MTKVEYVIGFENGPKMYATTLAEANEAKAKGVPVKIFYRVMDDNYIENRLVREEMLKKYSPKRYAKLQAQGYCI